MNDSARTLRFKIKSNRGVVEFETSKSEALLGRSENADLTVLSNDFSREHLRFYYSDNGFYAEDLCSSFGSIINDKQLEAGVKSKISFPLKIKTTKGFDEIELNVELVKHVDLPTEPSDQSHKVVEQIKQAVAVEIGAVKFPEMGELTTSISEIKSQNEEYNEKLNWYLSEFVKIATSVKDGNIKIGDISSAISALSEKVEITQESLSEFEENKHKIEEQIDQSRQELKLVHQDLEKLWSDRENKQEEIARLDSKIIAQKESNASLELELKSIQAEISDSKKLNEKLIKETISLESSKQSLSSSLSILEKQIKESEYSLLNYNKDLEERPLLKNELEELKKQRATLETDLQKIQNLVISLNSNKLKITSELQQTENVASEMQTQKTKLETEVEALTLKKSDLEISFEEYSVKHAKKENTFIKFSQKLDSLKAQIVEQKNSNQINAKQLDEQLSIKSTLLNNTETLISSSVAKLKAVELDTEQQIQIKNEVMTQIDKIRKEMSDLNLKIQTETLALNQLKVDQESFKEQITELHSEKEGLSEEIDQQRALETEKLQNTFVDRAQAMERDLASKQQKALEKLENDKKEWSQQRLKRLKTDLAQLQKASETIFDARVFSHFNDVSGAQGIKEVFLNDLTQAQQEILESDLTTDKVTSFQLKNVLSLTPNIGDQTKKYWKNRIIQSSLALSFVAFMFLFPSIPRGIKSTVVETLNRKPTSYDSFVNNVHEARKNQPKFLPEQDKVYRKTYTDNAIYLLGYLQLKTDSVLKKRWTLELNNFFIEDLDLDDRVVVSFISIESPMIVELGNLRSKIKPKSKEATIRQMTDFESANIDRLIRLLGSENNYNKFKEFEEKFYNDFSKDL